MTPNYASPNIDLYCRTCRGLCSVFRTRAGDAQTLEKILHPDSQLYSSNYDDDNGQDVRLRDDPTRNDAHNEARLVSQRPEDHAHNAHWLPTSAGPSRYVAYYDAASLYPSSGTRRNGAFSKKCSNNKNSPLGDRCGLRRDRLISLKGSRTGALVCAPINALLALRQSPMRPSY